MAKQIIVKQTSRKIAKEKATLTTTTTQEHIHTDEAYAEKNAKIKKLLKQKNHFADEM